jgi:alcohol dehydrogenase class IV
LFGKDQTTIRMKNFTFVVPKRILFGRGSLDRVGEELKELSGTIPLIITSKGMVKREGFFKLTNLIEKEKLSTVVFNKVKPEPSIETVEKCLNVANENRCDLIVGFGGGSAMDVAKKVAMDLNLPKIMIPTTAGTGSEVTHESVLKVEGKKRAFVDKRLIADVAVVDPSLMMTMPKRLIASSGMDALAHSVESYECKKGNELTRALAHRAYLLIKDNVRKAVSYDKDAISSMALASLMAGMAFGNSGTTLCHALTYPLSNKGIPHGEAIAIMLPPSLEFNNFDEGAILEIRKIIKDVGLPARFEGDVYEMAKVVMKDKRHLANNPRKVTFEDVVAIYKKVVGRV